MLLCTAAIALCIPLLKIDPTFGASFDQDAAVYDRYERYLKEFGEEVFVLVALRSPKGLRDAEFLQAVRAITRDLGDLDAFVDVTSITNLRIFGQRDGLFGAHRLTTEENGTLETPDDETLARLREAFPAIDFLYSPDLKTVGVVAKLDAALQHDVPAIREAVDRVGAVVERHQPAGATARIVGAPVLVTAIERYIKSTARNFGLIALIVGNLVSFYIFKSIRVGLMTAGIAGCAAVWVLGLMGLIGIPLNPVTALSIGTVLVLTTATVIHVATHFLDRYKQTRDRPEAVKLALLTVGGPALMCALTTFGGFAAIMTGAIPMVRQLGAILCLGTASAFLLAITLTPALLASLRAPDDRMYERIAKDWAQHFFTRLDTFVFAHSRMLVVFGILLLTVFTAGATRIAADVPILRMLSQSTQEAQDLEFVEQHLTSIHSVDVVVEAPAGTFKKADAWKTITRTEQALKGIGQVVAVDSPVSVVRYLRDVTAGRESSGEDVFSRPRILRELLALVGMTEEGSETLGKYVGDDFGAMRLVVRINNDRSIPLSDTLAAIRSTAEKTAGDLGDIHLSGYLAVTASQTEDLLGSQIISLLLALGVVTLLMMLQFRSIMLGLLSLIPNLFPMAVIFGFMGLFGIPLEGVTIFAAVVAIALSVDDTIHYLTQVRNVTSSESHRLDMAGCLANAYQITGKALISTSAILFFGFAVLINSPFASVSSFGFLASSAILAALFGDLVFLPATVLTFPRVGRLIVREVAPE